MATVSCRGTSGRYRFIEKLRTEIKVVTLLRFFDVSKSGYYDWRGRQPSTRALEDEETKLLNLRNMLVQGEQSGTVDYSYDSLLDELDKDSD